MTIDASGNKHAANGQFDGRVRGAGEVLELHPLMEPMRAKLEEVAQYRAVLDEAEGTVASMRQLGREMIESGDRELIKAARVTLRENADKAHALLREADLPDVSAEHLHLLSADVDAIDYKIDAAQVTTDLALDYVEAASASRHHRQQFEAAATNLLDGMYDHDFLEPYGLPCFECAGPMTEYNDESYFCGPCW